MTIPKNWLIVGIRGPLRSPAILVVLPLPRNALQNLPNLPQPRILLRRVDLAGNSHPTRTERIPGGMAELTSGQQDIRHRLTLIESRLAGFEQNLADQYAGYAGQSVRIDRLGERLGRIERCREPAD